MIQNRYENHDRKGYLEEIRRRHLGVLRAQYSTFANTNVSKYVDLYIIDLPVHETIEEHSLQMHTERRNEKISLSLQGVRCPYWKFMKESKLCRLIPKHHFLVTRIPHLIKPIPHMVS